jgi:hypothetical protein
MLEVLEQARREAAEWAANGFDRQTEESGPARGSGALRQDQDLYEQQREMGQLRPPGEGLDPRYSFASPHYTMYRGVGIASAGGVSQGGSTTYARHNQHEANRANWHVDPDEER